MKRFLIILIGFFGFWSVTFASTNPSSLTPHLAQLLKPKRSATFQCDNTIYVTSRPFDKASTELFTMNALTSQKIRTIGTTEEYGYDAIGFNHLDGYIYGISNGQSSGDPNPRLVRVDPVTGFITDLGTFPELAGGEWIIGTIMQDGSYVIGNFGGNTWLRIDLNGPSVVDGGALPEVNPLAWAANPVDNIIYGYRSWEAKLISFNPTTREYHKFENELTNVGIQACSTAFLQDGTMYLYCKTPNTLIDAMYVINLSEQTATKISEGEALGAGDMATCAFKKDEPPKPTPPSEFPGTWQNGNSCIDISEDGLTVHAYSKCGPFNCDRTKGILTTYESTDESAETITHGLITYEGRQGRIQELSMINSRTMRTLELTSYGFENRFNNYDRDIYKKVDKCRWKIPFPFPHPKPHPKPGPRPPKPQ
jgi:hypothetical protein